MIKPDRKARRIPARGPHSNTIQVRIQTPDGHRLRFSESLAGFVLGRPEREQRAGFRLGDWIASLDDATLAHLAETGEQALTGGEPPGRAGEDLLSVAIHAVSAERGCGEVVVDEESARAWLAALFAATLMESFRRAGLVEFDGRIGIESHAGEDVAFTVTDKGRAAGGQVRRWLN